MELVTQSWIQISFPTTSWCDLGKARSSDHQFTQFVKWGSSLCFVAVNNVTLRTWGVLLDCRCPAELPTLMEWSVSVPSNTVVSSPQHAATATEEFVI